MYLHTFAYRQGCMGVRSDANCERVVIEAVQGSMSAPMHTSEATRLARLGFASDAAGDRA
jgi:hypothetical protein